MKVEPSAWVYNWVTLFLGDINTGDLALQVGGVPKLRQQIIAMSPAGLGVENDCDEQQQL
jgi:hypothetical protein